MIFDIFILLAHLKVKVFFVSGDIILNIVMIFVHIGTKSKQITSACEKLRTSGNLEVRQNHLAISIII